MHDVPYWLDGPGPRFPPLTADERVDVAIVGGGVTGLACARVLANEGLGVRVLEARSIGGGASGRNGGFALRGFARAYAGSPAPDLMRATEEGLRHMAELARDAFRPVGSLYLAADDTELELGRAEHDALRADGFAADWLEREALPPLLRPHYLGGVFHPPDGLLDPGRWARTLADLATDAGAAIAEGTAALALAGTAVHTAAAVVTADQVVIATDGYTGGLLPELGDALSPARNQVLATEPLSERYFEPALYARYGFDYWQQTPDGRIILGGRRDADLEREAVAVEGTTEPIQRELERFLASLLGRLPAITHRWSGLIAFTPDLLPLVGRHPAREGVWLSLGYSGHGNVLALVCGEAVAQALLGRPDERLAPLSPERIQAVRQPA